MPLWTSSAIVRFGIVPLSHAATVVAWPSRGSQSSETIVTWSRNGSSGFRIGMNSKFSPVVFGVQNPGRSPSGTKIAPNRRCGFAAVFAVAVRAGTIDSSSGRARVTPIPRRKVRRGNAILVINIVVSWLIRCAGSDHRWFVRIRLDSFLKCRAVDYAEHERREPVVAARRVAHDLSKFRHVGSREPAAEAVDHQLFGDRAHEEIRLLDERLPQGDHAVHFRAVEQLAR